MNPNYSVLAEIYNHVMRRVRYDRWSEYLYYLTKEYLPENPKILELAAGNCTLTKLFARHYNGIIATDLSLYMLKKAVCGCKKVCCNMMKLPFKVKFDLIYSTFDSINYLKSKSGLLQMFREVSCLISDTGIFTFDVSMEKNSFKHIEEPVRKGKFKGISYVHKSEYDRVKKIHKNIFTVEYPIGQKSVEMHYQKIYPFETYFEIIPRAGLYVAACYKAFSFTMGSHDSERLQFILKKAGENAFIQ